MEKKDVDELRGKVPCAAVLERAGFKVDLKESTRKAVKYRRGDGEIVIVIHDGRGWFDPLSEAKGDVFSLAEHLGADGFADALKRVAELVGFRPTLPVWKRPARDRPAGTFAGRWDRRLKLRPGSPAWRYLADARAIPDHIIQETVDQDRLREGPYSSMWAAHTDEAGIVVGWEERGPEWRGFSSGGTKLLFRFGAPRPGRVCVMEAAIDAMSLAAIEGLRHGTAYVSTGGGWSPATEAAIRARAARPGMQLVAATDSNLQGDVFGDRIRAIAVETGAAYDRLRPNSEDWNDELRAVLQRAR
ncbi:DUF3991 and TOPRIM domain-containing protein [Phreatobacter sp. AB_2022a]|uniref:DUF3991 and TOPRIM domain-containing protein n=1 Tax=Phreatobacter sp. AB_2022a TaxID=3003134 RepID=UPI002286DE82|nr:DUF3991 and TOPRIM domain-containing protein [Phreatobacter sp. AB_2022a]MCZ0737718.1 DUF3991 and TOPRIM domain-containing protein [Phreatobacter sp. AB_2022a]